MTEPLPTEFREDYPYVVGHNWRYKQEVSEVVAGHLTTNIPDRAITGSRVARLLQHVPEFGNRIMDPGTTRYCHPFVQNGMDWFQEGLEDQIEAHIEAAANAPHPKAVLVNGWGYRQEFGRLGGDEVFWITQAARVPEAPVVKRRSGQVPAGLNVFVSVAGMRNRNVGLFAEVLFTTDNKYISLADAMILGKINPDTGESTSPYHAFDDLDPNRQKYGGCRPKDGTLFPANRLARFIFDSVEKIS